MELYKQFLPVDDSYIFREDGYIVFCGSMVEKDGIYYLYYSRWPEETGPDGWVIHSEVCLATSTSPYNGFHFQSVILPPSGKEGTFDRDVTHNPMIFEAMGMYYLYYTGNYGDKTYWNHRNHQRVGVAYSSSPEGPFQRFPQPLIDVTPGGFDSMLTSNPSVTATPNGKYIMMYKGVNETAPLPMGQVVSGIAEASSPLGPFRKDPLPVNTHPTEPFSVEDPFLWYDRENQVYRVLIRDMHGYFAGKPFACTAQLISEDGHHYAPDPESPFAYELSFPQKDGSMGKAYRLERPFLFFQNGKPICLLCSIAFQQDLKNSGNIHIPLKTEP